MIIPGDIYRLTKTTPLTANEVTYGTAELTYEVRQVTDVRDLKSKRTYRVTCTQRLIFPNANPFNLTPAAITSYEGYPALIVSKFTMIAAGGEKVRLLTYSPRTLNTAVSTSRSGSDGASTSSSRQHTSGSSTSETNTYGANASFGFFGDDLTGSIGGDWSHSETNEHNRSTSRGSDHGTSRETGASESMSVKDWASFAFLTGPDSTIPTWIWGQEYPWDIIQFRDCPTGTQVALPDFILDRLFDSAKAPTRVYPPSQLSLFGVDFTMKAAWLVDLPAELTDQEVTLTHDIQYATATHGLTTTTPVASNVTFDPVANGLPAIISPPLDLTLLGLDPIDGTGSRSGAVIGFAANKFVVPPAAGKSFKVLSDDNTLQVQGQGFDGALMTTFDHGQVLLQFSFKVVDVDHDYTLYFKHWKTGANGCQLSITFNTDPTPIYRHVDSAEGEGGDDNLTTVSLRNKDYTSVDYHDYLQLGLNHIFVYITPDNPGAAGYVLRALAISGS